MDILHLTHQFAPETRGGVESYLADIVQAQRRAGADVQVLTGSHAGWPTPGFEQLVVDGVPVHRLHRDDLYFDLYSKCWHPGVVALLDAFLERHRPGVVHIHQWIRLTANLVETVQRHGIAAVVTLHDYHASCPRAFRLRPDGSACFAPLGVEACLSCVPRYGHETGTELREGIELFGDRMRQELLAADAVLVGVGATADLVATTLGIDRSRLRVLGLGYRRRFPGQPPLDGQRPDEPLRFAFWGGVARHKGVGVLLAAWRRLCAERPGQPLELHVLGGFATPELERELRALGDGLPVTFHGPFHTDALRTLRPHVGVFPSTCLETFGIVLDECRELGLPCIVADRGALADRAGAGGLRVPAGDAGALAAAMRRFGEEPGLWQQLRDQAPPPSVDIETHVATLEQIYADAAVARREAGPRAADPTLLARHVALLLRQRESALIRLPMGEVGR
ncbi:MAG: glycosyltransferase [Planctomycetes bacterium]|nr:glycosyltransferase [Planctomycetota bacterium]